MAEWSSCCSGTARIPTRSPRKATPRSSSRCASAIPRSPTCSNPPARATSPKPRPPDSVKRLFAALLLCAATPALPQNLPLERIKLPPGFRIEVLAQVPNARSLALGAKGTLFVGNRSGSTVHAVQPGGKVVPVAEGLSMPNGVAFRDGALYIAEVGKIYGIDDVEKNLSSMQKPQVVFDRLPTDAHHGWKFIRFGPDGRLYISIGAPCNVCDRNGYALIGMLNLQTKDFQTYARGVRNTVG